MSNHIDFSKIEAPEDLMNEKYESHLRDCEECVMALAEEVTKRIAQLSGKLYGHHKDVFGITEQQWNDSDPMRKTKEGTSNILLKDQQIETFHAHGENGYMSILVREKYQFVDDSGFHPEEFRQVSVTIPMPALKEFIEQSIDNFNCMTGDSNDH